MPRKKAPVATIYDAARQCDVAAVKAFLNQGADVAALNEFGFTALQCAAMGLNSADESRGLATIDLLLAAGSPLEVKSRDGRTALYLAAEFSNALAPVQRLIDAGAETDISCSHGIHIVVNAMLDDVREALTRLTGVAAPPPPIELPHVRLSAAEWRVARERIGAVFSTLSGQGLVMLHDAGTTQEDGFSDCTQEFLSRGGKTAGLIGFCFYTRQDQNRAKRTSQLPLAFWGTPGDRDRDRDAATVAVGQRISQAFTAAGFSIDWDGTAGSRPTVLLNTTT